MPPSISQIASHLRHALIKQSPSFAQEWNALARNLPEQTIKRIVDDLLPQAASSGHCAALSAMLSYGSSRGTIRSAIGAALISQNTDLEALLPHHSWDRLDENVLGRALTHCPQHFNLVWCKGRIQPDCILPTVQQFINSDQPCTHLSSVVSHLSAVPDSDIPYLFKHLSYTVFYAFHRARLDVVEQILMHWPDVANIPDLEHLSEDEQQIFDHLKSQELARRQFQDLSAQLRAIVPTKAMKKI